MGERIGTSKSNALTSGPSVTNLKSGHDYSVFVMKWYIFFNFTYLLRCFRVLQVDDHWSIVYIFPHEM
jgi:hypothetical protein